MNDLGGGHYETVDVAVPGGTLRVGMWGAGGPAIVCAHGITANHTEFHALADQLGSGDRVIAPDLRGRGRSNRIGGPWGMAAHADDLAAVMDHLGIRRAEVLLGHSMGGFVAAVAAARHPDRFGRVLMVDGGLPLMNAGFIAWLPFSDFFVEKLVQKIIGPSLTRLTMTFESREAYRGFWRRHPALAGDWSAYLEEYVDYDLEGEAPALRPSTRKDALLRDVRTQLIEDLVPRSLQTLRCPVRFLRAPRGLMDDKPLYDERKLARAAAGIARYSSVTVPDVNHFTILLSARGARAVAAEVRALPGA
jgi:lipase